MKRGRNNFETCKLNGWQVGTKLIGDEGYGPAVIRITYLSHQNLLAVCESRNGEPDGSEHSWTLECRDWTEVLTMEDDE